MRADVNEYILELMVYILVEAATAYEL